MITGWVVGSCPEEIDTLIEVKEVRSEIMKDFRSNRGNGKYSTSEAKDFLSWYRKAKRSPTLDCSQAMKKSEGTVGRFLETKVLGRASSSVAASKTSQSSSTASAALSETVCPEEYDTTKELKTARREVLQEYKAKSAKYTSKEVKDFLRWYKTSVRSGNVDCSQQIQSSSMTVASFLNVNVLGKTPTQAQTASVSDSSTGALQQAGSNLAEQGGQNVALSMPAGMEMSETTDYIYANGQLVAKVTEVTQ